MSETILVIGAFDTKAVEHELLRSRILDAGCDVLSMNVGVMHGDTPGFPVEVSAEEVARQAGRDLEDLRSRGDRGEAMEAMGIGAAELVKTLFASQRFDGIIGMGGSGGSSVITRAMRALPLGVPKVCVSTVASSDTSPYVGAKDVVLIPSITDVSGLNRISRRVIAQAAGAICGMVRVPDPSPPADDRPLIVASMFGNTTECVDQCRLHLDQAGYEVLVFHAVGSGGRTMETLIEEKLVDGCLDITTTEWADELCGGIFSAGPDRLSAAGRQAIPHVIVPGCIDMVNFGPLDSVPARYREADRHLYSWNPTVTLMRTNLEENRRLGEIFAEKANAARGPIAILLPLRGVSILDGEGERFWDREADQAMFSTLRENLRSDIPVLEVDANINDSVFAEKAVATMLALIEGTPVPTA